MKSATDSDLISATLEGVASARPLGGTRRSARHGNDERGDRCQPRECRRDEFYRVTNARVTKQAEHDNREALRRFLHG